MDFLNKGFSQVADLFRSMTPGARLTAALLLVVAMISVAYLFNEQVSAGDTYLMGGEMFSANQLAEIESALGKANLEATRDGTRIKIPRGQEAKYMAAIAEAGALPADFGDYLQRAVNTNSWLASRSQQEALAKSARNRDLQNIIDNMRGIDRSAVQIAEDVRPGLHSRKVVTASVSVRTKGSQPLDAAIVSSIRDLMSGSVSGLRREAVTIVDLKSGRSFAGTTGDDKPGASMLGDYADHKRHIEEGYQTNIEKQLSYIPNVIVNVNAELDAEIASEQTSTEYEAKAVVYQSNESSTTKTIDSGISAGPPGLRAQGGVANQAAVVASSAGMKNNEELSTTEQRKAVPMKQQHTVREGRRPKFVTVAVAIPNTYYEEVWRQQNPQVEGQPEKKPDATALGDLQLKEKKSIEDAVLQLVPIKDKTADAYPQVTVSTYYPVSSEPLAEPSTKDAAMVWLGQYWSTLGMTGVALVSLVMLRSMVRAAPAPTTAPQSSAIEMPYPMPPTMSFPVETGGEESQESSARNRLKRRTVAGGPTLQEELSDIVREDPDAAVSILRNWIGAAS